MKLLNILPLLLIPAAHAAALNKARIVTDPNAEGLTALIEVLRRVPLVADSDPEDGLARRARPAPTVAGAKPAPTLIEGAKPAPTLVGRAKPCPTVAKRAKPAPTIAKRAKPVPTLVGRAKPCPTVAKRAKPVPTLVGRAKPAPTLVGRAKPCPTVAKRAGKAADPDSEEQPRLDSLAPGIARRENIVPKSLVPTLIFTLPTGRVEMSVPTHAPISNDDIAARPVGVQNDIGLTLQTSCSAFIPFTNTAGGAGDFPDNGAPRVYMDLDGANIYSNPKGLQIDTGSTGFTIGKDTWTGQFGKNWATTDKSHPGFKYLSSSDLLYKGYWVTVNITFKDLDWKPVIRSEIPVLVWDQKFDCDEIDNATGVCTGTSTPISGLTGAYMGIGYGRRGDGMTQCTPETNALLNVKGIWRDLPTVTCNYRNGYVVTKTGIYWGLTGFNTNNFKFHTLTKDSALAMDWSMPPMCLKVNALTCRTGNFLPDTGIIKSYISSPDIPSTGTAPPTGGLSVKLNIPNSGHQMGLLDYNNIGSGDNYLPSAYSTTKTASRVYINTGSRFWNNYETAFDAEFGYVGVKEL